MKVGLPRALLYYYYNPLWQAFFSKLGVETVESGPTTKEMVDDGVKHSVAEICVPIKIFCGHVAALLKQDVDYVFIPRMVSVEKHKHFCPKFLGLPDMMRHIMPQLEGRILEPEVYCRQESIGDLADYQTFTRHLGVSLQKAKSALNSAKQTWDTFRRYHREGLTIEEAIIKLQAVRDNVLPLQKQPEPAVSGPQITIGLLGYVYNIYDSFIGMDIIKRLRALGAQVVTFEMIDDQPVIAKLRPLHKSLPWTFSNKLLGAGYNFFDDPKIDGLIHVTAFGCGPDSMLGRMLEFTAADQAKPFMTIRVDEHSGEAHLATRVEAFLDMLRRKRYPA